jgi:hypothetical protein
MPTLWRREHSERIGQGVLAAGVVLTQGQNWDAEQRLEVLQ